MKRITIVAPTIPLSPVFVSLAEHYGIPPKRLAEKVLAGFIREKPLRILRRFKFVKA
jgi:hypothetical protein